MPTSCQLRGVGLSLAVAAFNDPANAAPLLTLSQLCRKRAADMANAQPPERPHKEPRVRIEKNEDHVELMLSQSNKVQAWSLDGPEREKRCLRKIGVTLRTPWDKKAMCAGQTAGDVKKSRRTNERPQQRLNQAVFLGASLGKNLTSQKSDRGC